MDLNVLNQSVLRFIDNGTKIISFLKDFTVGSAKDVSITYINADGSESVRTFANIAKMNATFEAWKESVKLVSLPNTYAKSKVITYDDGVEFELLNNSEIYANCIAHISFSSAGHGGAIYRAELTFPLSRLVDCNGNDIWQVPFSLSAHTTNDRAIELYTKENSRVSGIGHQLMMKISGESAEDVSFSIRLKQTF